MSENKKVADNLETKDVGTFKDEKQELEAKLIDVMEQVDLKIKED